MGRFLVDATDLDDAERQISSNYSAITMTRRDARRSPARTRIWRQELGELKVDDSEFTYGMQYVEQPSDELLVVRMHSGYIESQQPGHDVATAGPNEVMLLGPHAGLPFSGRTEQPRHKLIAISRTVFATAGVGDESHEVDLGAAPVSHAAGKAVADAIDYLRLGVMANPAAAENPFMASAALQYLVSCIVAGFSRSDPWAMTARDRRDASERNFRRATAYVDANAHAPLTEREIAHHVRVSTTSLRQLFARHGSCRPMHYVRRVRLRRARDEMMACDLGSTEIAGIARRWGFVDDVDFVRRYRREYLREPFADPRH